MNSCRATSFDGRRCRSMQTGAATRMVHRQIERRGVHDPRILAAMRKIDREAFLPEAMREFA